MIVMNIREIREFRLDFPMDCSGNVTLSGASGSRDSMIFLISSRRFLSFLPIFRIIRFRLIRIAAEESADQRPGRMDATDTSAIFFFVEDTGPALSVQSPIGFVIRWVLTCPVVAHFLAEDFDERFTYGVSRRGLDKQAFAAFTTSTNIFYCMVVFETFLALVRIVFLEFIEIMAVESVVRFYQDIG